MVADHWTGFERWTPGRRTGPVILSNAMDIGRKDGGLAVDARLDLPRLPTTHTLGVPGASRATKDGSHHANSGHRRRGLRGLDPRPPPARRGAPRPRLRLAPIRRSRPVALLPEPSLRVAEG